VPSVKSTISSHKDRYTSACHGAVREQPLAMALSHDNKSPPMLSALRLRKRALVHAVNQASN